nr:hypothetical protein [Tanacetum cinerariifolium]
REGQFSITIKPSAGSVEPFIQSLSPAVHVQLPFGTLDLMVVERHGMDSFVHCGDH